MIINTHKEHTIKLKVWAYTLAVYALIIALLFIQFVDYTQTVQLNESAIEVNLGKDETGFGEEPILSTQSQPTINNNQAPSIATTATNSSSSVSSIPSTASATVQSHDEDIAALVEKENQKTLAAQIPTKVQNRPIAKSIEKPQPIAVFNGNMSDNEANTNSNQYDSYGKNSSQGIIAGQGDMGAKNGSLYADHYGSSISVAGGLGHRNIIAFAPSIQDFESEGIIYIRTIFDRSGKAIRVQQDIAASTTTKKQLVDIALNYAKNIRINEDQKSEYEQVVTFKFVFKINL